MARTAKLHRLTALTVKRYAEASSQDRPLHDGGGLYLRKRDAAAWWYLRLTDPASGAEQWHRLFPDDPSGHYPHKTLADAREESRRLWNLRSTGVDPRQARQRQIEEVSAKAEAERIEEERKVTVLSLFDRWAQTDLQPRLRTDGKREGRKDGGQYTREQFNRRIFPKLGHRPVAEVTRGEWLAVLDQVKAEGKLRTANVLLTDLKQMLRFALARDIIDRNPLETILKRDVGGAAVERDRVLSRDELLLLARRGEDCGLNARSTEAIWLTLATGVRVGELMGAVWKSSAQNLEQLRSLADADGVKLGVIDREARTWHLLETKNQRDHTIHLSDFALSRIATLWDLRTLDLQAQVCPWVFPSTAASGPVCVKSFGKQLADRQRPPEKRMSGRARNTTALLLPGGRWTAHDLRRTAATLMAEIGVSGDVIDECLNHIIESKVRRVYIRNRREEAQAVAFDALGAVLSEIVKKASVT
jgi:integrase